MVVLMLINRSNAYSYVTFMIMTRVCGIMDEPILPQKFNISFNDDIHILKFTYGYLDYLGP